MNPDPAFYSALHDFDRARRSAIMQEILARVTGQSAYLLSYEDVRKKLMAMEGADRELKDIPLDAIIGSVGRYSDFTRSFLPRKSIDRQRWARVKAANYSTLGLPPVEVYQIGEAYFVQDGNHRVSIARQLGGRTIQAYVRVVKSAVPLDPNVQPDDLIIKAEYAEFLSLTGFKRLYPEVDITVTTPGRFQTILQQIEAVRFAQEFKNGSEVPIEEAVKIWFETIYQPTLDLIQGQNILREFPGRTETDLFLWILKYRAELAKEVGWEVQTSAVASELAQHLDERPGFQPRLQRMMNKFLPEAFKPVPPAGVWHERRQATREGRLFAEILVVMDGQETGWQALTQALQIAWLEGSQIHGLYVVNPRHPISASAEQALQSEFQQRCEAAQVSGAMAFEKGESTQVIQARARLVDLLVVPAPNLVSRKKEQSIDFHCRALLRRCPTPVLITQNQASALKQALLAYDGSSKSEQALFMASFLATFWELSLTMVSVLEGKRVTDTVLEQAKAYFDHYGLSTEVIDARGKPVETILETAQKMESDLLILGGYETWNLKDVLLGGMLDKILFQYNRPVLICN